MSAPDVVVVGQVARDLVVLVDEAPGPGGSATVRERREMLGGKGANQAVGMAQLGLRVALAGVVGADAAGEAALAQARADGIDVAGVVRRAGAATGLVIDVVDAGGSWRYLEDLPEPVLLRVADLEPAWPAIEAAGTVAIQLQQPAEVAVAVAERAAAAGARVLLDGAPGDEESTDRLLAAADVVRADAHEAELLTGTEIGGGEDAVRAGRRLLARGPSLVALAAGADGNALVWPGGEVVLPHDDVEVVDTTGGGDAFVAGLVAALARGAAPEEAGRAAVRAAGATVARLGGRPDLTVL